LAIVDSGKRSLQMQRTDRAPAPPAAKLAGWARAPSVIHLHRLAREDLEDTLVPRTRAWTRRE
jgi:hypothetical protein